MNTLIILGAKYLYLVIVLTALFVWWRQKRFAKIEMIVIGLVSLGLTFIASRIASHFYYDPRPFVEGHFTPLIPHAADNGFPSDHTLLSAAVSSVVFFFNRKAGLWLWVLTILVGAARVAAGVHHVADVLGAAVLAIVFTTLSFYLLKPWFRKRNVLTQ